MVVAPETDCWRSCVRKCQVHPAVMIEIEDSNAYRTARTMVWPDLLNLEHPLPWIFEYRHSPFSASQNQIDGSVIVVIAADASKAGCVPEQANGTCDLTE